MRHHAEETMGIVIPDDLVEKGTTKIVMLVMDGLGGLPDPTTGKTELEAAETPNLDALARTASLGQMLPVTQGVTAGSGPGHLALFGYDPLVWNIGRGVLSALGVAFPLEGGDVATRLNFATVDADGMILDRRAGRPSDEENRRLVAKLRAGVKPPAGVEVFFESEKEHRLVLVVRGAGLSADIEDTDPQQTGVPPLPARATTASPEAERTARIVQDLLEQGRKVLAGEAKANALLARGFAEYRPYPGFLDRYGLRALAIARYPMYRGVARLVGMEIEPPPATDAGVVEALKRRWEEFDFFFLHFKYADSRGEDGDFAAKSRAIANVDVLVPGILERRPDVLIVTGDHSTPARWKAHSWHPSPLLLASPWARPVGATSFGETECAVHGSLGTFLARDLMTLALANAGRLAKYGA
jgi:2,3-bisphosphoglycerate-independent phosphoglycerate mutase